MMRRTTTLENDVTVIGLGPVGLLAALAACNSNQKVAVVTDRTFYSRESVLECPWRAVTSVNKQLNKMVSDDQKTVHVMTQEVENNLYKRLIKFEGRNLRIIRIDRKANSDSVKLNVKEKNLKIIDFSGAHIEVKSKYFIGSDGSGHGMANQVNQQLKDYKINYIKPQREQLHPYHSLIVFRIPRGQEDEYKNQLTENNGEPHDVNILRNKFSWDLLSRPEAKVLSNGDVLTIGTEIPKILFNIKDRNERAERLNEWARHVLLDYLPRMLVSDLVKPVYADTEKEKKQQQMQVTVFEIELDEADRFIVPLGEDNSNEEKAYFMLFGDALKKPHYHTASGTSNGVYEIEQFLKFLKSKQSHDDLIKLDKSVTQILHNNRKLIDDYLLGRSEKERLAKQVQH